MRYHHVVFFWGVFRFLEPRGLQRPVVGGHLLFPQAWALDRAHRMAGSVDRSTTKASLREHEPWLGFFVSNGGRKFPPPGCIYPPAYSAQQWDIQIRGI